MKKDDGAERISLDVKGIDLGGLCLSTLFACATALVVAHWCVFGAIWTH